jgi:hypothetical protein
MEQKTPNEFDAEKVATKAIRKAGLEDHYDENKLYSNPAKNAKFGQHATWHMNLLPNNVVDLICAHETLESGIARAAEMTLDNTVNHRYFDDVRYTIDEKNDWRIGLIQEITARDAKGAFGEMWAKDHIDFEGEAVGTVPADEDKGIDHRTTEATYQIKVGENFKTGWEKKEADYLIWVEMDGNKVVDYHIGE